MARERKHEGQSGGTDAPVGAMAATTPSGSAVARNPPSLASAGTLYLANCDPREVEMFKERDGPGSDCWSRYGCGARSLR
jgi:hypothetical protein